MLVCLSTLTYAQEVRAVAQAVTKEVVRQGVTQQVSTILGGATGSSFSRQAAYSVGKIQFPTTQDISVAVEATNRRMQMLQASGQLPNEMEPFLATAVLAHRDLSRATLSAPKEEAFALIEIEEMAKAPFLYETLRNSLRREDFYNPETLSLATRVGNALTPRKQRAKLARSLADNQNAIYTHFVTEVAPQLVQQIRDFQPQFQQVAEYWTAHQPDVPAAWAAEQVPVTTDNLFIGEIHLKFIPQQMIPMLDVLKETMGDREIIFLTEFLPQGHVLDFERDVATLEKNGVTIQQRNYPLWRALSERNIPVIGLEPDFVDGTLVDESVKTECKFFTPYDGQPSRCFPAPFWTSLEGKRIRNRHWIEEIQKQRAAHPNSLFIIYGGSGHINGLQPFSVAREVPGENFIIDVSGKGDHTTFDAFAYPLQMPDCFLLRDKQQAEVAGFNVQIKLGR